MDLESLSKSFTESLGTGPFGNLFTNPIYVALLITIVIVLIIICIDTERRLVKSSFYIFCTTLFVIFVHNKLLIIEHRKKLQSQDETNIVNVIGSGPVQQNSLVSGLNYLSAI